MDPRERRTTAPPQEQPRLRSGAATKPREGRTSERPNDDSFLQDPVRGLFVVADGVGGAAHGDLASRTAVELFREAVLPANQDARIMEAWLQDVAERANEAILAESHRDGRATTLAVTLITALPDGARAATILHIGDSRVSLLRAGSYTLEPLTLDHSTLLSTSDQEADEVFDFLLQHKTLWNELNAFSKARKIHWQQVLGGIPRTREEARAIVQRAEGVTSQQDIYVLPLYDQFYLEHKNYIRRHLGAPELAVPTVITVPITTGDHLLLTTDGVHDGLSPMQIAHILRNTPAPEVAAKTLTERSTAVDDRTAIAVHIP